MAVNLVLKVWRSLSIICGIGQPVNISDANQSPNFLTITSPLTRTQIPSVCVPSRLVAIERVAEPTRDAKASPEGRNTISILRTFFGSWTARCQNRILKCTPQLMQLARWRESGAAGSYAQYCLSSCAKFLHPGLWLASFLPPPHHDMGSSSANPRTLLGLRIKRFGLKYLILRKKRRTIRSLPSTFAMFTEMPRNMLIFIINTRIRQTSRWSGRSLYPIRLI